TVWRARQKRRLEMKRPLSDIVVDVVDECYRRVFRAQPGSENERIAERAILMAISDARAQKSASLLWWGVYRNARHSVRRGDARLRAALQESARLARVGIATGGVRGFVHVESPEGLCIARDLSDHLHAAAKQCGRHGPRVLEGLLNEESSREISKA